MSLQDNSKRKEAPQNSADAPYVYNDSAQKVYIDSITGLFKSHLQWPVIAPDGYDFEQQQRVSNLRRYFTNLKDTEPLRVSHLYYIYQEFFRTHKDNSSKGLKMGNKQQMALTVRDINIVLDLFVMHSDVFE